MAAFPGRKLVDPARFLRLARFLRRERFDVVHLHLTYATILGSLAAAIAGTPAVASIHNTRAGRWGRLELFALRHRVPCAIAVGQQVADVYGPLLPGTPLKTIPNAVVPPTPRCPAERAAIRERLGMAEADVLALAVGRLVPQKGYPDLIAAMDLVRQKAPAVRLVIAGDGELRGALETQVAHLGLGRHVRLLGTRRDVAELMAAADVFVNSSHWEGLPVAILEAMAAGLPVVATAVGDAARMIDESTGIIVPAADPAGLAAALCRLAEDRDRRTDLGRHAREYVAAHHDPKAWVEQLRSVYRQVARA